MLCFLRAWKGCTCSHTCSSAALDLTTQWSRGNAAVVGVESLSLKRFSERNKELLVVKENTNWVA